MKVCEYCGTENIDSAVTCSTCQAHSFRQVCPNCGTQYKDAAYCPRCGVRAGTKAKTCPDCGTAYFTPACPNCGYTPARARDTYSYAYEEEEPPQKKVSMIWWVLGWIFIFPVPVMALCRRSGMNRFFKVLIPIVAWLIYLSAITRR